MAAPEEEGSREAGSLQEGEAGRLVARRKSSGLCRPVDPDDGLQESRKLESEGWSRKLA